MSYLFIPFCLFGISLSMLFLFLQVDLGFVFFLVSFICLTGFSSLLLSNSLIQKSIAPFIFKKKVIHSLQGLFYIIDYNIVLALETIKGSMSKKLLSILNLEVYTRFIL